MFDPLTMLAALMPSAVKLGDALVQRYIVPDKIKPASVAEAVQLAQAENERIKIITSADSSGETYKWVEAVRKLQRPIVVFVTLGAFVANPLNEVIANLFSTVMWYLFGERFIINQPKK